MVKGFVNILLQHYKFIQEFKGYYQRAKEAIPGTYGCHSDILISLPDEALGIIISILEIYFPLYNWVNVSVVNHRKYMSFKVP
jgi:hypothetical protein